MSQGIKSVDEYFKEMKLIMTRANVEDDMEDTTARFMNSLNHDIAYIVELYHYMELENTMHMVMKVEKQFSTPWKSNWKAKNWGSPSQPNKKGKAEYPREMRYISTIFKGNNVTSTSCNYDIKCFYFLGFGYLAS